MKTNKHFLLSYSFFFLRTLEEILKLNVQTLGNCQFQIGDCSCIIKLYRKQVLKLSNNRLVHKLNAYEKANV